MTAPTLRELIERATPGPWECEVFGSGTGNGPYYRAALISQKGTSRQITFGAYRPTASGVPFSEENRANAKLIARCSPETLRAVLEALEHVRDAYIKSAERCALTPQQMEMTETWRVITRALALLNGEELP